MSLKNSKFESYLANSVLIGGGVSVIPFYFLFMHTGVNFPRWYLYVLITVFLVAIGITNSVRDVFRKRSATSKVIEDYSLAIIGLAVSASFLVGSILSMCIVLTYLSL